MQTKEMALAALILLSLISATAYVLSSEDDQDSSLPSKKEKKVDFVFNLDSNSSKYLLIPPPNIMVLGEIKSST